MLTKVSSICKLKNFETWHESEVHKAKICNIIVLPIFILASQEFMIRSYQPSCKVYFIKNTVFKRKKQYTFSMIEWIIYIDLGLYFKNKLQD